MTDVTKAPAICWELHRLSLVIESAVRRADPDNHAAVLALIGANQDVITGRAAISQVKEGA